MPNMCTNVVQVTAGMTINGQKNDHRGELIFKPNIPHSMARGRGEGGDHGLKCLPHIITCTSKADCRGLVRQKMLGLSATNILFGTILLNLHPLTTPSHTIVHTHLKYNGTSIIRTSFIRHLDCPDLVYPTPRLSRHA